MKESSHKSRIGLISAGSIALSLRFILSSIYLEGPWRLDRGSIERHGVGFRAGQSAFELPCPEGLCVAGLVGCLNTLGLDYACREFFVCFDFSRAEVFGYIEGDGMSWSFAGLDILLGLGEVIRVGFD